MPPDLLFIRPVLLFIKFLTKINIKIKINSPRPKNQNIYQNQNAPKSKPNILILVNFKFGKSDM